MADPAASRAKWLWLALIVLLAIALIAWMLGAGRDPGPVAEPDLVEEGIALPPPTEEEAVEVELPDADFDIPEPTPSVTPEPAEETQ